MPDCPLKPFLPEPKADYIIERKENSMIEVGDKVKVNHHSPVLEKYCDKEYIVQNIGRIGQQQVAWLRGIKGAFSFDCIELVAKLERKEEKLVAKIKDGKIVEMNV